MSSRWVTCHQTLVSKEISLEGDGGPSSEERTINWWDGEKGPYFDWPIFLNYIIGRSSVTLVFQILRNLFKGTELLVVSLEVRWSHNGGVAPLRRMWTDVRGLWGRTGSLGKDGVLGVRETLRWKGVLEKTRGEPYTSWTHLGHGKKPDSLDSLGTISTRNRRVVFWECSRDVNFSVKSGRDTEWTKFPDYNEILL